MTRRYDPRLALPHQSYTREELAQRFKVSLGTVSAWRAKGLQAIDGQRPYLFAGAEVRAFLLRHNKPYQPTGPGEVYCVACKLIVEPAGGKVVFVPLGPRHGNLEGTCPHCFRGVRQRVRKDNIQSKVGNLKVRFENGSATICRSANPPHTDPSEETAR